jgi:hypothetical protein
VNVRDIRMVQGRERLCFAGEPGQPIGVAGEGVREDFERDVTIQFRVAGAVDQPHPAFADLRNDFVDAESSAGCEWQVVWIIWAHRAVRTERACRLLNGVARVGRQPPRANAVDTRLPDRATVAKRAA